MKAPTTPTIQTNLDHIDHGFALFSSPAEEPPALEKPKPAVLDLDSYVDWSPEELLDNR